MDDQHTPENIRYFLQRKAHSADKSSRTRWEIIAHYRPLSSVQLPQEPTLWILHYKPAANCRSGIALTSNQPTLSIDTSPCWLRRSPAILAPAAQALPIAHKTKTGHSSLISIFFFTHSSSIYRRNDWHCRLQSACWISECLSFSLILLQKCQDYEFQWSQICKLTFFFDRNLFLYIQHTTAAKSSGINLLPAKVSVICFFQRCQLPCHSSSLLTGLIQFPSLV